jgi:hypothetical protein
VKNGRLNMSMVKWGSALEDRLLSLYQFGKMVGAVPEPNRSVWSEGRYLILHFDLVTTWGGSPVSRQDVYDAIPDIVEVNGGGRLGGSVFMIPLLPSKTSLRCAAEFWNALQGKIANKLLPGDSFYLHYAPDVRNLLGGIAQVVPSESRSLGVANVPEE